MADSNKDLEKMLNETTKMKAAIEQNEQTQRAILKFLKRIFNIKFFDIEDETEDENN